MITGKIIATFKTKSDCDEAAKLINGLARTRRMARDLTKVEEYLPKPSEEYGVQGELFYPDYKWPWQACCGQNFNDPSVVEPNIPPVTQPSLWLHWVVDSTDENVMYITRDPTRGFYHYIEWMQYLIDKIIAPRNGIVNGHLKWSDVQDDEHGSIYINDNIVKMDYSEKTKFLAKIAKEVENNPDMFVDILNYAIMGFQKSKKHTKEDGLKYNVKDK